MTIIINHPNEIKNINNILKKHNLASEANINKEKTQIFVIGKRSQHESET